MLKITQKLILITLFLISVGNQTKAQDTLSIEKTGFIPADSIFKLLYIPVDIPKGVKEIRVEEFYNESADPTKNVLNIGIYDERGYEVGNPLGFRGWSGGAKKAFFINSQEASTGYVAGEISPGTWNILIYPSTIIKAGIEWKLNIKLILGEGLPETANKPAYKSINNKKGWYRGDLHMHTFHSDGQRTEQNLIDEAFSKKLDFIISTEHNTNSANQNWGKYQRDDLLIINGEEVTSTEFGHWNAIGLNPETYIDWRYTPDENRIIEMVDKVHADKGLAIINHPFYHVKLINSFKYDSTLFDGVEVWNGNWNILNNLALKWWDEQLRFGKKMIGIGASDSHKPSGSANNLGSPQTVVYANGLNKKSIIEGIKKGKVYVAIDSSIVIDFSAQSENQKVELGGNVKIEGSNPINVIVKIQNCLSYNITLHSEKGIIKSQKIESINEGIKWDITNEALKFLRIEIRADDDKMIAFTNPIWIEKGN